MLSIPACESVANAHHREQRFDSTLEPNTPAVFSEFGHPRISHVDAKSNHALGPLSATLEERCQVFREGHSYERETDILTDG